MSLQRMRSNSLKFSAAIGAVVGTAAGAIIIPGLGAAAGFTIGALVGWRLGERSTRQAEENLVERAKRRSKQDACVSLYSSNY